MVETINGIEYTNFGSNNYSRGMEAVIFNTKDITAEDVAKLPGFYLHPELEPEYDQIYALKGTFSQYLEFCKAVMDNLATKHAVSKFGLSPEDWNEFRKTEEEFKDTWTPWFWK